VSASKRNDVFFCTLRKKQKLPSGQKWFSGVPRKRSKDSSWESGQPEILEEKDRRENSSWILTPNTNHNNNKPQQQQQQQQTFVDKWWLMKR
jgi:hypothetical protein